MQWGSESILFRQTLMTGLMAGSEQQYIVAGLGVQQFTLISSGVNFLLIIDSVSVKNKCRY